jgi:hypothetical protein
MTAIPRKYSTDARNQKQAVILDIETFNRMESGIVDHGLGKFMEEVEDDEVLFCPRSEEALQISEKGLKCRPVATKRFS